MERGVELRDLDNPRDIVIYFALYKTKPEDEKMFSVSDNIVAKSKNIPKYVSAQDKRPPI